MSKRISTVVFAVAASVIFICVMFSRPNIGVSDQNDFRRVMFGIDNPSRGTTYREQYASYTLSEYPLTPFPHAKLLPFLSDGEVHVSQIYFIFCARILSKAMGLTVFNMHIYTLVLGAVYIALLTWLYTQILPDSLFSKIASGILLLFIFMDGRWLMWFNSLYGEPIVFIGLLGTAASFISVFRKRTYFSAAMLTISAIIMIGGKLQAVELLVLALILFIYLITDGVLRRKYRFSVVTGLCAVICVIYGIGVYSTNTELLGDATTYNTLMTGLLVYSDDPAAALDELSIDNGFAEDAGKSAYLPASEYSYAYPSDQLTRQEIYAKFGSRELVGYYLRHPVVLWRGLVYSSSRALNSSTAKLYKPDAWLGIYPLGEEKAVDHNRFTLWSDLRQLLPKNIAVVLSSALIFTGFAVYMLIKRKILYGMLSLSFTAAAALQFAMPFIFNGTCDTSKQLLVFTYMFDALCFIVLYAAILFFPQLTRKRRAEKFLS